MRPNEDAECSAEQVVLRRADLWPVDLAAFLLLIAVGGMVAAFGGARISVSWVLSLLLLVGACFVQQAATRAPRGNLRLAAVCYSALTVIGLVLLANYQSLYGLDCSPHGDDSEYYISISHLANGLRTGPVTLYERIMACWYSVLTSLVGEPRSIDLLPLNWSFGAFAAVLTVVLSDELSGGACPRVLAFLAIIGNSIFVTSVVNLYRDGFMLVFYLLAFIAAFKRSYGIAIIAVVACSMVRMANAGVALVGLAGVLLARISYGRRTARLFLVTSVLLVLCVLVLDRYLQLGTYFRTVAAAKVQENRTTIIEQAMLRGVTFIEKRDLVSDDAMAAAYSMGPARYLLMPALTLFAPFKFNPPVSSIGVHVRGYRVFRVHGLNCEALLAWITCVLWIVLGPLLVLGFWRATKGTVEQKILLLVFFFSLMGVSLVSFQGRHRCAFIVFFPAFLGLARPAEVGNRTGFFLCFLCLLFMTGIWARNFLLMF